MTGVVREGQPQQTWTTSSTKQVALVSSSRSLHRTPVKRSSAPRRPSRTTPTENPDYSVQPTSAIKPPAHANPKATSPHEQTTEDMAQAIRPYSRGIQWWWDFDAPYIESDSESISSTKAIPSSHDESSSRRLPIGPHSNAYPLFIHGGHQHRWLFRGAQQVTSFRNC